MILPVLLPEVLLRDWLNPRYRAGEILREAAVGVRFAPAEKKPQQLRMKPSKANVNHFLAPGGLGRREHSPHL